MSLDCSYLQCKSQPHGNVLLRASVSARASPVRVARPVRHGAREETTGTETKKTHTTFGTYAGVGRQSAAFGFGHRSRKVFFF